MTSKVFLAIWEELGKPNIFLVPPVQYEQVDGDKVGDSYGVAADNGPVITLGKQKNGKRLRGTWLRYTIYEELAHKLWVHRRHWWIECFAQKMSGSDFVGIYSKQYGHSVEELPSRERLLKMAQRASKRFNKRKEAK